MTLLGDWSSVLMACGVESAILQNTGVLTMPEWCVANSGVLVILLPFIDPCVYICLCRFRFPSGPSTGVWGRS